MTQPTDKVRADFEDSHLEMNLTKTADGDYMFLQTDDCYRSYMAGHTAALNEQSAEIERLNGELAVLESKVQCARIAFANIIAAANSTPPKGTP